MIVELVRGGLADVGVIFGHWDSEDSGRTFDAFHKDFRMYEKYVTKKEKVKARALREVLAKDLNRSLMLNSDTYRERHNAKCDSNPELKPIQAIEELDILTDDIWNGLDKVFTSTYEGDLAHNMGGGDEAARDLMDTYRLRVRGFLDEYVEQELDGIAPEAMDERQRRLLRVPVLAAVCLSRIRTRRLPFPTNTMVKMLPLILGPYSPGVMEVRRFFPPSSAHHGINDVRNGDLQIRILEFTSGSMRPHILNFLTCGPGRLALSAHDEVHDVRRYRT
jgi:hypothetical protein